MSVDATGCPPGRCGDIDANRTGLPVDRRVPYGLVHPWRDAAMSHAHYRRPRRGGGAAFIVLVGAAFLLYLTWIGGLLEPLPIAATMVTLVVVVIFAVLVRRHHGTERESSTAHV